MLICQIELRFPKESPPPTFMSLVRGLTLKPDLYVRFVPLHKIPTDTEEKMNDYLYQLYKEKVNFPIRLFAYFPIHHFSIIFQDELVDYYEKTGKFPGTPVEIPARKETLYNWLAWLLAGAIVMPYYLVNILLYGSWLAILINVLIAGFGKSTCCFPYPSPTYLFDSFSNQVATPSLQWSALQKLTRLAQSMALEVRRSKTEAFNFDLFQCLVFSNLSKYIPFVF